jgi:hypothetical protein
MEKATIAVAFVFLSFLLEVDLYFQRSELGGLIWQVFESVDPFLGLLTFRRIAPRDQFSMSA